MRPTPTADAHNNPSGFLNWNSPLPYLFGGLGLMLLLIATALIILACSYRKSSSRSTDHGGDKATQLPTAVSASDNRPKIVVIMAGDDNPTRLAVPISSSFSISAKQLP
ncbi:protein GLUTAMINE DUMPER 6-like [Primulina huaijiensis]|uniref:protein GLUTAMINE DUMPER 6-like n=1 Tax=Primulina huaijiensis TaxID=1492673 RepID=UPI003CC72966